MKASISIGKRHMTVQWFLLLPAAYFVWSVLNHIPILQHEIIGLIYWWNADSTPFLSTLFDSSKMDSYPGRFRYVEYLAEAAYWKALFAGYLPRDLYDYFSIFVSLLTAGILVFIGRKRNIPGLALFLVITFFLLSCPNEMVGIFHFRKAKSIVTLLFALIALETSTSNSTTWNIRLILYFVIGFFSDPFFIVLAPLLFVASAIENRARRKEILSALLLGIQVSAVFWFYLNGLIGPKYSSNARWMLWGFQGKPATVLDPSAIAEFPRILTELLLPSIPYAYSYSVGMVLLTILIIPLIRPWKVDVSNSALIWALVLALPISAFLIRPLPERLAFSGYYGQPLLVFVALALFQWMKRLSTTNYFTAGFGILFILLFTMSQRWAVPKVYHTWVDHHISPPGAFERVSAEYQKLRELNETFSTSSAVPVYLNIGPNRRIATLGSGLYYLSDVPNYPSDLVAILFPMLYWKEISDGRLRLLTSNDS